MKNMILSTLDNVSEYTLSEVSFSNKYQYNDRCVPRVTEILSAMLYEEFLIRWANSMGFKHKGYHALRQEAAEKGTYTHKAIEEFLVNGIEPDYESIPYLARNSVMNTFGAFKKWWDLITLNNKVEIIAIEEKLVCKYFGGTLDCLLKINDKIWLIDFKSSNHMSYKYWLQLGAYNYMLEETRNIKPDGCLVLMLNKENPIYTENILDFSNEVHNKFINDCIMEFLSLVMSYYGRLSIENQYKQIFG